MTKYTIISAIISLIVTAISGRYIIPALRSVKMGQKILDIGPRWHKSKEGTPTMGGITFILGTLISCIVLSFIIGEQKIALELLVNGIFVLLCGLTGFIDDYVKFFKKQNQGLTAMQKLVLQFASAGAYVLALSLLYPENTSVALPFISERLELGFFYYIFMIVGIVFTVNSVNLTDGIDGLASSVTLVATIFLAVLSVKFEVISVSVLAGAIIGGTLGFLIYNFYPAKVFMGDTGSLFLGGAVSALAVMLDMPILLIFVGFIYYLESVSVMLQVFSFKVFKKRIFKMSPIHHHFEMCGWNEIKIVFVFSAVTILLSILGAFGFLLR